MSKKIWRQRHFRGGISESEKEGTRGSFAFSRNLNIYKDANQLTLLPATSKVSGSTVVDLVKWIVPGTPYDSNIYYYGDTGHIYSSTSAGASWSDLRTVASSSGQGMELYTDYLYYTQDSQIGRYGPLSSSPSFTDNWQTGLTSTSTTKFAPIKAFKEGFAVGHGNKLAWYDGSTWTLAKITLPPGFTIRTLDVVDEFLAMGAWRGTSITDSEVGLEFFWDGSATTFNFFREIPEGAINATVVSRNRLLGMVGSSGLLYELYPNVGKLQDFGLPFSKYMEVLPGAMSNWKGIIHLGVAGATDSTTLNQGIYQYGSKSERYPEALTCGYTISTGSTVGASLKIGAVKGIGNQLYASWQDGSSYGIDRMVQTGSPFSSGTLEGLIFDDNRPEHDKLGETLSVNHKALATGESIQLGYKSNRAGSYTTATANATVGTTQTRLPVAATDARNQEFQYEVILAASGSTSPTCSIFHISSILCVPVPRVAI